MSPRALALLVIALPLCAQGDQPPVFYYYEGRRIPLRVDSARVARFMADVVSPDKFASLRTRLSRVEASNGSLRGSVLWGRRIADAASAAALSIGSRTSELVDLTVYAGDSGSFVALPQILIRFKAGTTDTSNRQLLAAFSREVEIAPGLDRTYLVRIRNAASVVPIANMLFENRTVEWATPNFLSFRENSLASGASPASGCQDTPATPLGPNQWHLENSRPFGIASAHIRARRAWSVSTGKDVRVAVIDDGIRVSHEALQSRLSATFDVINNSAQMNLTHLDWHGTAVAGVVAASPVHAAGVKGVGPDIRLLGIRAWDTDNLVSGTTSAFIAAAVRKAQELGADVINASWNVVPNDAVQFAIEDAIRAGRGGKGIVFVAAAGNDDGPVRWPARLAKANSALIAVAATNQFDRLKRKSSNDGESDWGSNTGPEISIAAPGVGIITTAASSDTAYDCRFGRTSGATPQVAGAAALLLASKPGLTAIEVKKRLMLTADKVEPGTSIQWGRLNACRAIASAQCD